MRLLVLRGGAMARGGSRGARHAQGSAVAQRVPAPGHSASRSVGTLAVAGQGQAWALLNMSPSVAQQLECDPRLRGHAGLSDAQVRAVVLTDAQVDHGAGLLGLRDGGNIDLYATPAVFEDLTSTLPVLPVLQHYCAVHWRVIAVAGEANTASFQVQGMPDIDFTAVATGCGAPLHSPRHGSPIVGDSVALAVHDRISGTRLFCATGTQALGSQEFDWMAQADAVVVSTDSLLRCDDEAASLAQLARLASLSARHKVLLPPAQVCTSAEQARAWRRQARAHGLQWACDGLEIAL